MRLPTQDDGLVGAYFRRLADCGAAVRGMNAYQYQLRAILRAANRLSNSTNNMEDLFRDTALMGSALVDDGSVAGSQLSKWTLAQRRSALRSFASLMRPELRVILADEPLDLVDQAAGKASNGLTITMSRHVNRISGRN